MLSAIILESDWSWWVLAGFAVLYGLAVMVAVVTLLFKSRGKREQRTVKKNSRQRVTGERP